MQVIQKCTMKYLVFLVATTVYQITANPSTRRRRGYLNRNPEHSIAISSREDSFIHPPWWRGSSEDVKPRPRPNRPFGSYEAFEINHGGFGGSSSEEEQDTTWQTGPSRRPGYGGPSWWRPPGSSTTEINISTGPTNPNENNRREQIAFCIKSCLVTAEFNPVCGSNNVTYTNHGRLECEQRCGIDVQLSRPSACSVPPPNETGVNPSLDQGVVACVRNCQVTTEYSPVCGSNNVTYANHGQLLCEQFCGIPVELSKLSPCSNSEQSSERPLTTEQQKACMRSCPVTGEYNPVCGSDNVTYSNPGRFECAQNCGVAVKLSKPSACGGSEPTFTENTLTTEGLAAICMRSCPVTSEFNPVCGSNNVTYTNPGRLECAQNCGIAVTLVRHTSCETSITIEENKYYVNNDASKMTESNLIPTSSTTTGPYINGNAENSFNIGNNDIKNNNDKANNNLNNGNDEGIVTGVNLNNDNKESYCCQCCHEHGGDKEDNNLNGKHNENESNQRGNNSGYNNNDGQSNSGEESTQNSKSKGRPGYGGHNHHSENWGHNGNHENNNCIGVNNRKPPSLQEVMVCMQTCSLSSESNPVCGTDSITYMNPGRLLCAQFCGVDVKVKKFAPCESTSITNMYCPTTCTNPPVTDNPGPVTPSISLIDACMEACPASLEFNPVCGSNNVSYRNLESLLCARRCGIDVSLKRSTHCSAHEIKPNPKDNTTLILECIEQCSVPQKYEPICGSNNVTYNNTGHLICARQCGLDIQINQTHPCSTVTSTTTEKVQVVQPGQNGMNFTIDPAVLDDIWGTTSTTPKDDDEDFDLDQRVQDQQ